MRALVQRVTKASVAVAGETAGEIGPGLVILLGVSKEDDEADARYLVEKIVNLRIFADDENRFNRSALDVGAEFLVVSQFTLYADTRKGRRPDFNQAAGPEEAKLLYEHTVQLFRDSGITVATGRFQEHMLVTLENDGPVTLMLDSADRQRPRRGSTSPIPSRPSTLGRGSP
ncbi:MAG: D-tyrosyl-tRNA(Tyr) deacylase [Chloroflexi bacterium]|nr:D-tyrosyl-tRNA(Tyr) deacylase [Chloroflexota bacterium]